MDREPPRGAVAADESPIGWLPKSLNTEGLELGESELTTVLGVDSDLVAADLDDAEQFLASFGDRLPQKSCVNSKQPGSACHADSLEFQDDY